MAARVLIAVTAYNEAKFIVAVLDRMSATAPNIPILVVNDGSTDDTSAIVQQFQVHLIEHVTNYGKGEAIRSAFSFAEKHNFDWIIFLDGDGQHPPEFLPNFIQEIERNRVDVLVGKRKAQAHAMPFHRQLSNGITSILISLCAGRRIHDSQCGYRAIRLCKMKKIILTTTGFQVESELLLKLGKTGAMFGHVPIVTVYGEESSSIDLVGDTLKFIKLIINSLWW